MVATSDKSQREVVLDHLGEFGSITPLEALNFYGIGRLSARIQELREDGHQIATHQDGPHDFATYELVDELVN
jgi:hypothetical protein